MISLDGDILLGNCCISRPERYLIYYENFKGYIFSIIGFDELDKSCWKHDMPLFQQRKKGRYICHYMSDSQYKPG